MADLSELESKFLKADAAAQAGDAQAKADAALFASEIKRLRSTPSAAPQPASNPSEGGLPFRPLGIDTGLTMPQGVSRFAAGAGKAFTDLGRGTQQLVGMGPTREEMSQVQQRDRPLMATGAGVAGNITGNLAATLPTMAVPGVNTYTGAAALGGTLGALQPVGTGDSRLLNTAVGTAGGVTGQAAGNLAGRLVAPARQLTLRERNASDAIRSGYALPPSEVNPSMWNSILSGGNKHAMADRASLKNTQVLADAIRKDLPGLRGEPTPESLGTYIAEQGDAGYAPVEALRGLPPKQFGQFYGNGPAPIPMMGKTPPTPEQLLHDWKSGNARLTQLYRDYNRNGRVETADAIDALKTQQASITQGLEDAANAAGKPALIAQLREARTNIAKAHDVIRSMGDTSTPTAGRLATTATSGKLTGELETAYKAAKDFPDAFKNPARIHPSDPWGAAALGVGMGALGGFGSERAGYGPLGATLAAVPFLKGAARQMALSRLYQRAMVDPAAAQLINASPRVKALIDALRMGAPQAGAVGAEQMTQGQ